MKAFFIMIEHAFEDYYERIRFYVDKCCCLSGR